MDIISILGLVLGLAVLLPHLIMANTPLWH